MGVYSKVPREQTREGRPIEIGSQHFSASIGCRCELIEFQVKPGGETLPPYRLKSRTSIRSYNCFGTTPAPPGPSRAPFFVFFRAVLERRAHPDDPEPSAPNSRTAEKRKIRNVHLRNLPEKLPKDRGVPTSMQVHSADPPDPRISAHTPGDR